MHRRHALKMLTGLALCPLCARQGLAADHAGWSYGSTDGPAKWGDLDAANRVCSVGDQQSPIDIRDPIKAQLTPLKITWDKQADTIVNNGHTIQLDIGDSSVLEYNSTNYRFLQFHFHRPSEHLIDGKNFPMEAHFVHANVRNSLAVVAVLMATGRPNPVFNKIVSTMPETEGPAVKADPAINPNGLLPATRSYYRYSGSLTTPPCSETVDWLLFTDPIQVADADVARFAKLYPMDARPVQKTNRRFVLKSA
jgi:carbonic anhydrase